MEPTKERSAEEIAEIERHKYYLSEKAGQDVGWEQAEQDWEANHGEEYRVMMGTTTRSGVGSMMKRFFRMK